MEKDFLKRKEKLEFSKSLEDRLLKSVEMEEEEEQAEVDPKAAAETEERALFRKHLSR